MIFTFLLSFPVYVRNKVSWIVLVLLYFEQ